MVFLPAMGMFYLSDLLGGSKNMLIGNVIKDQILITRDWPLACRRKHQFAAHHGLAYSRLLSKLKSTQGARTMIKHLARYSWLALIVVFLYLPMAVLIGNSFNASKYGMQWKGWTLKWYSAMMHNASLIDAALHSITIGF